MQLAMRPRIAVYRGPVHFGLIVLVVVVFHFPVDCALKLVDTNHGLYYLFSKRRLDVNKIKTSEAPPSKET